MRASLERRKVNPVGGWMGFAFSAGSGLFGGSIFPLPPVDAIAIDLDRQRMVTG